MSVKTLAAKRFRETALLFDGENPFSTNKVTGHSLNVPIIGTCLPSTVCADRCYFARGPSTWNASLRKQHRLLNSLRDDPTKLGTRIADWAKRLKLTFVRWNGGGDLIQEHIACIAQAASLMPTIPQWVVSRKAAIASKIVPMPNVFVQFSLDNSSRSRLQAMQELVVNDLQWFYSYQCDKGELPEPDVAPVIYRDNYKLNGEQAGANDCPLNVYDAIDGVCGKCRRCFNGEAVRRVSECRLNLRSREELLPLFKSASGGL